MDPPPYRHLVRTKLVPPSMPDGMITRERVVARLSSRHRFTLVSAMPGYGKTAVARQWVDTVDGPVAWLSLDVLDQEPMTFWSHVLYAIGAACPGVDREASMLLAERGAGDPLFLSALAADLIELADPLVLVLDGLPDQLDRFSLDGLALLVDRAGDVLRTVVTSRIDPPLPLVRWRTLGWLADVREDELRLTDDEAIAIAAAVDTSFREAADVVALNRRVDGWPIALHMAVLARPASAPRPLADLLGGTDRLLANYLVGEVLEAMPESERSVALALSVLDWFDPDLCRDLVGDEGAPVVRELLRRGVFLSVVDPRAGAMRFHDLFRDLMERELGWRDPSRRVDLHRRAAVLLRERGDLMSAYHHLSVIGETGQAQELLVGPALELVDRGDLDALQRFARQLPILAEVTNPGLALDLALVASYADGTRAARGWADRAEALLAEPTEPTEGEGFRRQLQGLRCAIALLEADLDAACAGIEAHRRFAPAGRGASAFEARFSIVAARVMLAARQAAEADEWISIAERLEGPEIVARVTVPTLRAWHEWWFGSLEVAVELTDGALRWMAEHRVGAHHLAFDTLITGAWCQLAIGNISEAVRLAEQAAADAETLGSAWNHLQAGYLSAGVALATGDPQGSLRILDALRSVAPFETCRPYAERLLGLEVEALAATGRSVEAERLLAALEPGARTRVLQAQLRQLPERDVEQLLAPREEWATLDRVQAELLVAACDHRATPSPVLVDLVEECSKTGWVLPFLGLGPRVEHVLRALPLEDLHPQLARARAHLASDASIGRGERPDLDELVSVHLTPRERTLVELLPTHLSYAEIGERLFLSVNTVKSNLKAVYRKLDVTTRAEAVEACRRGGLVH